MLSTPPDPPHTPRVYDIDIDEDSSDCSSCYHPSCNNIQKPQINIPDLRFSNSYIKAVQLHANSIAIAKQKKYQNSTNIEDESKLTIDEFGNGPITFYSVLVVTLRDQIMMPFLQGFFWAGTLLAIGPVLRAVVRNGIRTGTHLRNFIGLGRYRVHG